MQMASLSGEESCFSFLKVLLVLLFSGVISQARKLACQYLSLRTTKVTSHSGKNNAWYMISNQKITRIILNSNKNSNNCHDGCYCHEKIKIPHPQKNLLNFFRLCRNNNVNRDPDQVVQSGKQCFIRKGYVVSWLAGSNPSKRLRYNIKVYLYRAVLKRQSRCFKWLPLETTGDSSKI